MSLNPFNALMLKFVCAGTGFAALALGLVLQALCIEVQAKTENLKSSASKNGSSPNGNALKNTMAEQSLALDLVRYGDRTKDPLALIQAARMQQTLGTRVKETSVLSQAMLLQRARAYSHGRQDLAMLIDDVSASGSRGSLAGPILEHFLAPVNELQKLVVRFTGGVRATFALKADEPQKLEVEVLDASGKPVCVRSGEATRECSWTPSATGDYQIRIRNIGTTVREYSVFHN
jgi:hypothetical protein